MKKLKPNRMPIINEINKVAYQSDKNLTKAKQLLTDLINALSDEVIYFKMSDRPVRLKVDALVNKLHDVRNTMDDTDNDTSAKARNMLKQASANMIKQKGKLFNKP